MTANVNFNSAKQMCADINATLARISSAEEHSFVNGFFDRVDLSDDVWIGKSFGQLRFVFYFCTLGLEDVNGNGGTAPTRFTYVDGTLDQSFYGVADEFPWGDNQPNNFDNSQNCVE